MEAVEPLEVRTDATPWTRYRRRGVDRRTRAARRWAAIRAGYVERLNREPTADDDDLLDLLSDLMLEIEVHRARRTDGRRVGARTAVELVTEARRIRMALGIGSEAEMSLAELMGGNR
jgi:hypothetical protein